MHRIKPLSLILALLLIAVPATSEQFRYPGSDAESDKMKNPVVFDPEVSPFEVIGNIDRISFPEPSGIVFHPKRKSLFVVGDEGDICEIETDGTPLVMHRHEQIEDFEGITCDPSTGLLYIAIEGKEQIIEVEPKDLRMQREFYINRNFNGNQVMASGKGGVEGITFVPNILHPHGGTFYVSNQNLSLTDKSDRSAIFELEVPLKGDSKKDIMANIVRFFSLDVIDITGLHYDKKSGHLFAICDEMDKLLEVTRKGTVLRSWDLPGNEQGGITFDDKGLMYIAEDTDSAVNPGGIYKIKWDRKAN